MEYVLGQYLTFYNNPSEIHMYFFNFNHCIFLISDQVDNCNVLYCQNDGTCVDQLDDYRCQCTDQ